MNKENTFLCHLVYFLKYKRIEILEISNSKEADVLLFLALVYYF